MNSCRTIAAGFRQSSRALAAGLLVLAGSALEACNVPVFRYALERWRPDPYRAVVFHEGPLSAEDRSRLKTLEDPPSGATVNLAVRTVDVRELAAEDRPLFESVGRLQLPVIAVQYPAHLGIDGPAWSGRLADADLAQLVDSPVRRELVKRLTNGETAVGVLLESGDPQKDDPAAQVLQEELALLQRTLKLPELSDSPDDVLLAGAPLRLAFSFLRLRRDDPAEQALVALLLGCESDLAASGEPLVFPVFGRGRALLPLVGAGISSENIRGSAAFLAGKCSCQVKELNPGFDLLIAADWAGLLALDAKSVADLAAPPATEGQSPELVSIPSGAPPAPTAPAAEADAAPASRTPGGGRSGTLTILGLVAGLLVIVAIIRPSR